MEKRYRKQGIIGTILFHALLLAILGTTVLEAQRQEEEGLLVNFGYTENGSGDIEPAPAREVAPAQPAPAEPTPAEPAAEPTAQADGQTTDTQDFEEAAALAEAKKKAEAEAKIAREKAEAEAKAKAESEAKAKAEAEAIARAKAEAEAKAKAEAEAAARAKAEAEAKAKAEAEAKAAKAAQARGTIMKGFSGEGTGTTGNQGTGTGTGNQGSLTGGAKGATSNSGNGTGNSFSLEGRSLVGSLPKPDNNFQESGKVVVDITVDKTGTVTNATVRMKGTTTQNTKLWSLAIAAAKKAKFNSAPNAPATQQGTITYNFILQ